MNPMVDELTNYFTKHGGGSSFLDADPLNDELPFKTSVAGGDPEDATATINEVDILLDNLMKEPDVTEEFTYDALIVPLNFSIDKVDTLRKTIKSIKI